MKNRASRSEQEWIKFKIMTLGNLKVEELQETVCCGLLGYDSML
jgi:hypothetical protein